MRIAHDAPLLHALIALCTASGLTTPARPAAAVGLLAWVAGMAAQGAAWAAGGRAHPASGCACSGHGHAACVQVPAVAAVAAAVPATTAAAAGADDDDAAWDARVQGASGRLRHACSLLAGVLASLAVGDTGIDAAVADAMKAVTRAVSDAQDVQQRAAGLAASARRGAPSPRAVRRSADAAAVAGLQQRVLRCAHVVGLGVGRETLRVLRAVESLAASAPTASAAAGTASLSRGARSAAARAATAARCCVFRAAADAEGCTPAHVRARARAFCAREDVEVHEFLRAAAEGIVRGDARASPEVWFLLAGAAGASYDVAYCEEGEDPFRVVYPSLWPATAAAPAHAPTRSTCRAPAVTRTRLAAPLPLPSAAASGSSTSPRCGTWRRGASACSPLPPQARPRLRRVQQRLPPRLRRVQQRLPPRLRRRRSRRLGICAASCASSRS